MRNISPKYYYVVSYYGEAMIKVVLDEELVRKISKKYGLSESLIYEVIRIEKEVAARARRIRLIKKLLKEGISGAVKTS